MEKVTEKPSSAQVSHTPGPWMVDFVVNGAFQISGTSEGDQCVLAQRAAFEDRHFEFIANARLMAAAPDMREACELFTAAAHEVRDLLNDKGFACPASIALAAEKARNAIAKAEGR